MALGLSHCLICQLSSQACSLRLELIASKAAGKFQFKAMSKRKKSTPAKAVASSSAPANAVVSSPVAVEGSIPRLVVPEASEKMVSPSPELVLRPSVAERMAIDPGLREREVESVESFVDEWDFLDAQILKGPYASTMGLEEKVVVKTEKIDDGVEIDELAESESGVLGGGVGGGEGRKRKAESVEESPRGSPSIRTLTTELIAVAKERALTRGMIDREGAKLRILRLLDKATDDLDRLSDEIPESASSVLLVVRSHQQVIEELGHM